MITGGSGEECAGREGVWMEKLCTDSGLDPLWVRDRDREIDIMIQRERTTLTCAHAYLVRENVYTAMHRSFFFCNVYTTLCHKIVPRNINFRSVKVFHWLL